MEDSQFVHGQEVMVFDHRGSYEFRGKVVGIHRCNPAYYDVQRNDHHSLAGRKCGLPGEQLRAVGKPYLAYERRSHEPRFIKDEA